MKRWRELPAEVRTAIGIALLIFVGLYLPLDLLYALRGILTYATPAQLAGIFLWMLALSVAAGAVLGALLFMAGVRLLAVWLALALSALAVMHGFVMWMASVFAYTEEWQSRATGVALAVSVAVAAVLARKVRPGWLDLMQALLRAGTALMAVLALAAAATLGLRAPSPALPAAIVQAGSQPVGRLPPIVLITIDALSALHLPMYGYERPTAPRLAQFSRQATIFLRNYANSNFTPSSMASMMYGTRPWTHRLIQHEAKPLIGASPQPLPARLASAGYYTVSVSTNPWAAPRNLQMGAAFHALSEGNVCAASNPLWVLPTDVEIAVKTSSVSSAVVAAIVWVSDLIGVCRGTQYDPELAFSQARLLMDRAPPDRPLFLWVHLFPPHDPYVTPPPFLDAFEFDPHGRDRPSTIPPYVFEAARDLGFPGVLRLRYDQAIRYADAHIGAFFDELRRRGLYDRSLIVVTADHGESLSKNYGGHGGPALHDELVRIPLLIKTPGQAEGKVVDQTSEQVDLLPTILDLAGIEGQRGGEGVSLVPAMAGRPLRRPVFSMNFQQSPRLGALDTGLVAMVEGRWKYVHYFGHIGYPYMPVLHDALYEIVVDPWETRNRIAARPDVAVRMLTGIEEKLRQHGRRIE